MDYLHSFPDKFFDWSVDDPPYFSGPEKRKYYGKGISSTGVTRPKYEPMESWAVPGSDYFKLLKRKTKNQIIWGVNHYKHHFGPGRIVWDKCNGSSSFSDCELAYCSAHDSARLYRFMWNGMNQGRSILEGHVMEGNKKLNEKRIHATQKPVKLYQWIYLTYIPKGSKVHDGHVGSGSNRIAAHEWGCDFYGSEINESMVNLQEYRFQQHIELQKQQFKLF